MPSSDRKSQLVIIWSAHNHYQSTVGFISDSQNQRYPNYQLLLKNNFTPIISLSILRPILKNSFGSILLGLSHRYSHQLSILLIEHLNWSQYLMHPLWIWIMKQFIIKELPGQSLLCSHQSSLILLSAPTTTVLGSRRCKALSHELLCYFNSPLPKVRLRMVK